MFGDLHFHPPQAHPDRTGLGPALASIALDHDLRKALRSATPRSAELLAPAVKLVRMHIGRASDLRHHRSRRKRPRNQRYLVRIIPAPAPLRPRKYRHLTQRFALRTSAPTTASTDPYIHYWRASSRRPLSEAYVLPGIG